MCPNRIASLFYFAINHCLYNISCKVCQVGLWHYEMRNNVRITHISFGSKGQVVKCEWLMTNRQSRRRTDPKWKGKWYDVGPIWNGCIIITSTIRFWVVTKLQDYIGDTFIFLWQEYCSFWQLKLKCTIPNYVIVIKTKVLLPQT